MMTLSLAIRNLLRNRRRSLATLLAMAIGATAILLFGGFKTSISYGMQTTLIQQTGHLQIQHQDFYLYGSGDPTAYGIADYVSVLEAIKKDDVLKNMVLVVTPTLQFGGIAGNYAASVSRTVIGKGYVAEDANRMRRWNGFGMQSNAVMSALEGALPDAAVVGIGVARVLQLCGALGIADCPRHHEPKAMRFQMTSLNSACKRDQHQPLLLLVPSPKSRCWWSMRAVPRM